MQQRQRTTDVVDSLTIGHYDRREWCSVSELSNPAREVKDVYRADILPAPVNLTNQDSRDPREEVMQLWVDGTLSPMQDAIDGMIVARAGRGGKRVRCGCMICRRDHRLDPLLLAFLD